jgi:hypothetical protein
MHPLAANISGCERSLINPDPSKLRAGSSE